MTTPARRSDEQVMLGRQNHTDLVLVVPYGKRSIRLRGPHDTARWLRDQLSDALGEPRRKTSTSGAPVARPVDQSEGTLMQTNILMFVSVWALVAPAIMAGAVASTKGRDRLAWFLAGLCFGVFGLLGAVGVMPLEVPQQERGPDRRDQAPLLGSWLAWGSVVVIALAAVASVVAAIMS